MRVFGKRRGPFSFSALIQNREEIGSFLRVQFSVLSDGKGSQRDIEDTDPFELYDPVPEIFAHAADLTV